MSNAPKDPFLTDVRELRKRARRHIENGAVVENYRGDRENVIKLLNVALATGLYLLLRSGWRLKS